MTLSTVHTPVGAMMTLLGRKSRHGRKEQNGRKEQKYYIQRTDFISLKERQQ